MLAEIIAPARRAQFETESAVRLAQAPPATRSGEWDACARSAYHFIDEYVIIDEPQGAELATVPFKLWPAQADALVRFLVERLIIVLKARQIGLTWLVLAYFLWLCLFKPGRVCLLFSKTEDPDAYELLRRVKAMYLRLPDWMRAERPIVRENMSTIEWSNGSRVQSLAATKSAGRSFTASAVLLDEFAHMLWGPHVYTALKPVIDGGGQLFLVSTANGETGLFHDLWQKAAKKLNNFYALFLSWRTRIDRTEEWRAKVAADAVDSRLDLQEYPDTDEDAFQATGNERFLPSMALWDACKETLPSLDKREPAVLVLDAGVTNDHFGLLLITRHPERHADVAVRYVQEWIPPKGGQIDFQGTPEAPGPELMVRLLCQNYNVISVTYDPHELRDMAGRLNKEGIAWFREFPQGAERLEADKALLDLVVGRRVAHDGNAALRAHISNADRKVDAESRKLRIVKREDALKIDLAVCASMGAAVALELNI